MLSARDTETDTEQGSLRSIASQIRAEKGVRGFWSGYSASLVLTLNPSLTFFFFEALKRTLLPRNQRQSPSPQATFIMAAISKAMASTITYPFSLAKSRLQASSGPNEHESSSTIKQEAAYPARKPPINVFTMIVRIAQTEGLSALYEGLGGEVMKGFFSHGITMIAKEAVHKLVIQLYYSILKMLRKYPSPQELAASVKEQAVHAAENVEDLTGSAKERSSQMAESIRISAESSSEQAGRIAANAAQQVKQAAVDAKAQAGQLTGDLGERSQNIAESLGERKQQAAKVVSDGVRVAMEKSQDLARTRRMTDNS